jgi:hypothetical protein
MRMSVVRVIVCLIVWKDFFFGKKKSHQRQRCELALESMQSSRRERIRGRKHYGYIESIGRGAVCAAVRSLFLRKRRRACYAPIFPPGVAAAAAAAAAALLALSLQLPLRFEWRCCWRSVLLLVAIAANGALPQIR